MTIEEINEQFELAKIRCSEVVDLDSTPPIHHTAIKASTALAELDRLQSLVTQIYTQAKAEALKEVMEKIPSKLIAHVGIDSVTMQYKCKGWNDCVDVVTARITYLKTNIEKEEK